MSGYVEKAAVLRVIFDSVGKPATEIYQKVREVPETERAGWVRAAERMPDMGPWATFPVADEDGGTTDFRESKPVLVIDGAGELWLAQFYQERWNDEERIRFSEWISLQDLGTLKDVVWWTPTPEPPEEETDMSGVYIKGFQLPEKSDLYYVKVEQEPGKNPVATIWRRDALGSMSFGAFEAINVPDHGRLIDEGDVYRRFEKQWEYLQGLNWYENPSAGYMQSGINWCINALYDDIPTIIPTDKEADSGEDEPGPGDPAD